MYENRSSNVNAAGEKLVNVNLPQLLSNVTELTNNEQLVAAPIGNIPSLNDGGSTLPSLKSAIESRSVLNNNEKMGVILSNNEVKNALPTFGLTVKNFQLPDRLLIPFVKNYDGTITPPMQKKLKEMIDTFFCPSNEASAQRIFSVISSCLNINERVVG